MRSLSILILSIILTVGVSIGSVYAEGPEVSGSASVDVMSNYVWRGLKLSNAYVVQPSVGITYGGFGANLWANWDSDWMDSGEHTETDLTLNYSFSVDKLSFDTGYIYYALEGSPNDTQEVYMSAGFDVVLSPALTVYYDFEEGHGAFIVASVGHSFELPEGVTFDVGASASFNAENLVMGTDADGEAFSDFYNADLSASLSIPISDEVSVAPMIAYTFPLSDDAENAIEMFSDDSDSTTVYGGINATLSF
ncbi:bacterial protein of unknown function [bacterium BMS3Abin10]|nr:bacterial protein of unknown function [bacterium BMS3Abin10]